MVLSRSIFVGPFLTLIVLGSSLHGQNCETGTGTVASPVGFASTQTFSSGNHFREVVAMDVNGYEFVDLVASNFGTLEELSVFRGNGDGTFQEPTDVLIDGSIRGLFADHVDEDGFADLITVRNLNEVVVLPSRGDGTFRDPVVVGQVAQLGLTVVDISGDGITDIIALGESSILVFLGQDPGFFAPALDLPVLGRPGGPLIGDFDGDSVLDVATSIRDGLETRTSIYRGIGGGSFEFFATQTGFRGGPYVADLNQDGYADLL
jgi:hypothetical protein